MVSDLGTAANQCSSAARAVIALLGAGPGLATVRPRARPFLPQRRARCGTVATMALDPVTRRELRRLHARLGLALALLGNPVGTMFSWFTKPTTNRLRRRIYVSADGDVSRIEDLPASEAVPPGTCVAHDCIDGFDSMAAGNT